MAIRNIQIATCDMCDKEIDLQGKYIDAMYYGAAFHLECVKAAKKLLKALNLDEIILMPHNEAYIRTNN